MADSLKIVEGDMKRLNEALRKNKQRFQTAAVKTVEGSLKGRIFNDGIATNGGPIGKYAPSTKKSRRKKGRRTDTVDLEDSGTLRRSIQSGVNDGNIVLGFVDTDEPDTNFSTFDNAVTQEQRFKKDIFAPTSEEEKAAEQAYLNEILEVAKETLMK